MMKHRVMWLLGAVALVVVAYAQISFGVRGAIGFGSAGPADSDTVNARFGFSVAEYTFRNQSRLSGYFSMIVREEQAIKSVNMYALRRLTVNLENRTATFSGPAVLGTRSRTGFQRTQGVVVVQVVDNRSPRDPGGSPDTISVAFYTNPDADPVFTYQGVVKQGDIRVVSYSR